MRLPDDEKESAKLGNSRLESESLDSEGTDGGGDVEEEEGGGGLCPSLSLTMIEFFFLDSGGVSDVARGGRARENKSDCRLGSKLVSSEVDGGWE